MQNGANGSRNGRMLQAAGIVLAILLASYSAIFRRGEVDATTALHLAQLDHDVAALQLDAAKKEVIEPRLRAIEERVKESGELQKKQADALQEILGELRRKR